MATKNFDGITLENDLEQTAKKKTGRQTAATQEEIEQRQAERRTSGRKGAKLPRINLALSSVNYDYVKIMARMTGSTQQDIINGIIDKHRAAHSEEYDTAKDLLSKIL